jgi:transcriptional regulator with XRE-family HTH domain
MGYARQRPKRLAEKLLQIRTTLGLSQTEFHKQLGVDEHKKYIRISDYEMGKNEPSLIVLLEYARLAGVHLEVIADDRLDLPRNLPGSVKYDNSKGKSRLKGRKVG